MIGLLATGSCLFGLALAGFPGQLHRAKTDRVRMDLQTVRNALQLYRQQHGQYPPADGALQALVDALDLAAVPRDPWGNPYRVQPRLIGLRVLTYGADGMPGGTGADADLSVDVGP